MPNNLDNSQKDAEQDIADTAEAAKAFLNIISVNASPPEYTKRQRINTWLILSVVSIACGATLEIVAELYFPSGWFQKIATFLFAGSSLLSIIGIFLSLASLALDDWKESKRIKTIINNSNEDLIIKIGNESYKLIPINKLAGDSTTDAPPPDVSKKKRKGK